MITNQTVICDPLGNPRPQRLPANPPEFCRAGLNVAFMCGKGSHANIVPEATPFRTAFRRTSLPPHKSPTKRWWVRTRRAWCRAHLRYSITCSWEFVPRTAAPAVPIVVPGASAAVFPPFGLFKPVPNFSLCSSLSPYNATWYENRFKRPASAARR